jgi:chromosome segregation ATPase
MTSRRIFLSGGAVFAAALATAPRLLADGGAPTINTGKKKKTSTKTTGKPSNDCKALVKQIRDLDRKLNSISTKLSTAREKSRWQTGNVKEADARVNEAKNEVKKIESQVKEIKRDKKRGYSIILDMRVSYTVEEAIKDEKKYEKDLTKAKRLHSKEIDNWVKQKSKSDDLKQKIRDMENDLKETSRQKRSLEKAYKRAKCS